MKNTLKSLGLVALLALSNGCFPPSKPQPWNEKDVEAYAGEVSIPNIKSGRSRLDYRAILWDINGDGKIDLVTYQAGAITMIAKEYLKHTDEIFKRNRLVALENMEVLDERTREDLTRIYQAQKDFLRNYLISKGIYTTNSF